VLAQKQLAKLKIVEIFLGLELPRSRQDFAFFRSANLARALGVAIRLGQNRDVPIGGGRAGDASRKGANRIGIKIPQLRYAL
jgi:hypothetical protein